MIHCSHKGCLASYSWFDQATDTALATLAKERGWVVHEGSGWKCPHHAKKEPLRDRAGWP